MLISIITINYNNSVGLEKTINSVKNQSFSDFEYIIIDGGSSDTSIDVISRNKELFSIIICEKDNGIYDAMNKGIDLASGNFLFFLNSGDLLISDALINFSNFQNGLNIYYGHVKVQNEIIRYEARDISKIIYDMPFCHQAVFVPTNLMKKEKFNLRYIIAADYDFFLKEYLNGTIFIKTNFDISNIDTTGISNSKFLLILNEYVRILYKNFKGINKIIIPARYLFHKRKFILYRLFINLFGLQNYNNIKNKFNF